LDRILQLHSPWRGKPKRVTFGRNMMALENLECRLVPAVSFSTDNAAGSILLREDDPLGMGSGDAGQGDGKDNLDLRVVGGKLEFLWTAPDRVGGSRSSGWQSTNWDVSVADATKTRTIQIKVSGDVRFVSFLGDPIVLQGSSLIIDGKMSSGGQTWDSARSPDKITISTDIRTLGGNLTIYNAGSITVDAGKTISTRKLATGVTDDNAGISGGNSGNIVIKAENPDKYNSFLNAGWTDNVVTIGAGAKLLAHAISSGGTTYSSGGILVSSENTDIILIPGLGGTERKTRVDIESGAIIKGDDITISAQGGELDATVAEGIKRLLSNTSENPGGFGFLANLLPLIGYGAGQILDLPLNVDVRIASAEVNIKDTANTDARTLIQGDGDVSIKSFARSTAFGKASMTDTGTIGRKAMNALGSFGFAIGFMWSQPKATTSVGKNVKVDAGGDIEVLSEIHALANNKSIVTANTGTDSKNNISNQVMSKIPGIKTFADDKDETPATRYDRKQLAASMQIVKSTSAVLVDTGSMLTAGANATIKASGESENVGESATTSFGDGQAGITFTFGMVNNDITTTVNGSVTANSPLAAAANVKRSATFNPFTDIDNANNRVKVTSHGYSDGQKFVYDPGRNREIPGLESGKTYIAVIPSAWSTTDKQNYFQVFKTNDSGAKAGQVTFTRQPGVEKAGQFYGFSSVDPVGHALVFAYDPGLQTGDQVTYRSAPGKTITGITDGTTYRVVRDASPFHRYYLVADSATAAADATAVAAASQNGYTNGATIGTETFRGYQAAYDALIADGKATEEATSTAQIEAMIAADHLANQTTKTVLADVKPALVKPFWEAAATAVASAAAVAES
ncbi:MAG: hypothetical protein ACKO26_10430, partial [Planctomycetota bacterium]